MAILELEEGRKKALAELISYKATAKQLDNDLEKYKAKAAEWERRAMVAVKAGDDEAAKTRAAREEGARDRVRQDRARQARGRELRDPAQQEPQGVRDQAADPQAAQGHARDPDRGGALGRAATRSATTRRCGTGSRRAEDRIDQEAIETEVDAAMRGEDADGAALDAKISARGAGERRARSRCPAAPRMRSRRSRRRWPPTRPRSRRRSARPPAPDEAAKADPGGKRQGVTLIATVGPGAASPGHDPDEALSHPAARPRAGRARRADRRDRAIRRR